MVLDLPVDPSVYLSRHADDRRSNPSIQSVSSVDLTQVSYELSYTAHALGVFHSVFGLHRQQLPSAQVSDQLASLRVALLQEELDELVEATNARDIVEVADALADIVYLAYGTALNYGINLDAVLEEVHRSNMSKLDEHGAPLFRADGKVAKSNLYQPPNVQRVLVHQPPLPF